MKRSMIMDFAMLENLTQTPERENILVGTGPLARDMQKKLTMLGLKVPYLIGLEADSENGILCYRELASLGDPKKYRFIMCCDKDEFPLMVKAQTAMHKFLGPASGVAHEQEIVFGTHVVRIENSGKYIADASVFNTFLNNGLPYSVFGDKDNKKAFQIHYMSSCLGCGLQRFSEKSCPELLHEALEASGFENTVYAWGKALFSFSDILMLFMRDVTFHKIDLLITYLGIGDINPLMTGHKNILPVKTDSLPSTPTFIKAVNNAGVEACTGIEHTADSFRLRELRQKILAALSRRNGFAFWDIIGASHDSLSETQGWALRRRSPGYLARQRKNKEKLLSVLNPLHTKDYSDTFANIDDIYDMFVDYAHYTDAGGKLIAGRCAADILKTFSGRQAGKEKKRGKADGGL